MAAIDQVRNLKQQGMNDSQVATALQEQGIAPREINDAISQSNIKDAVSNPMDQNQPMNQAQGTQAQGRDGLPQGMNGAQGGMQGATQEVNQGGMQPGMQPSILDVQNQQQQPIQNQPQGIPQQQSQNQPMNQQQGMPQQPMQQGNLEPLTQEMGSPMTEGVPQPGQAPEPYPQESAGGYASEYGAGYDQQPAQENYGDYASQDTMSEVASQMVTEKTKTLSKKIKDLEEMGTLLTAKVEKIDERLSRIESLIDNLQTSLLRKATAQEQNIGDIKSEMGAMQDSFGKIINPLVSHTRKKRKTPITKKKKATKKKKK
jgi:hypothetical protein